VPKGPEAFRTISEAAEAVGVAPHVLRFWETRFTFIKPMKLAGGRRFYRPRDIDLLCEIRRLLHQEGYTIKGVQKRHREQGLLARADADPRGPPAPRPAQAAGPQRLQAILEELDAAKARLDALLGERP
jgi:DNA-binding transcriptional MerR regulator